MAVTLDQIQRFNIPPRPEDKETLDKVNRDSRKGRFIKEYGQLYITELDALLAIVPEEFRDIVQNSVDQYFDPIVWDDVRRQHSASRLDRLVRQKIRFLDDT